MRSLLTVALSFISLASIALAEDRPVGVPESYRLLYSQDFSKPDALTDFVMSDASAWRLAPATDKDPPALELHKQSKYKPAVRSPFNIALIGDQAFGDCIIEAECLQTGKEYGHRDMVIFFGFEKPDQFYYTHIATKGDDHANQIFIVNKEPRLKISTKTNVGNNWGLDVWHKVRVERRVSDGTIKVYFDDLETPIMEANDKNFGKGWVGFGSFDDTGKVTRVRVWGTEAEKKTAPPFVSAAETRNK